MPRSNMAALRRKNGVISGGSDDTLPRGNVRDATHLLVLRRLPSPAGEPRQAPCVPGARQMGAGYPPLV